MNQDDWSEIGATASLDMAEMDELVRKSVEAWEKYEEAKKLSTEAYNAAEAIDQQILSALKAAGKTKYFVDDVGTMSINSKLTVRVPSTLEAKKQFFDHLKSISYEVFLSLATVNSNSLNAWYNSKLEEAAEKGFSGFLVPGIEQPTTREGLRFNKVRKTKNG